MKNPTLFLSSTFHDLKFERRFVIAKLRKLGFDVVCMEEHCKPEFDWRRWSTNRAGQCEFYLKMFDNRIGSQGNDLFVDHAFKSITALEDRHSRDFAIKSVAYQLRRPFPDRSLLFNRDEEREYESTMESKDEIRDSTEFVLRQIEDGFRKGKPIDGVAALEHQIEADFKINYLVLLCHRLNLWRRSYADNCIAAWRHAFEDESLVVLVIAYIPSFAWVGTKTVISRGAFAARIVQQPIDVPFRLVPRWLFLENWTGVGAISLVFMDGQSVFIPLINEPSRFSCEIRQKVNVLISQQEACTRHVGRKSAIE